MQYLLLGSIVVILILLVIRYVNNQRRKNTLNQLRAIWGHRKSGPFDFARIKSYVDLTKEKFHRVNDQTLEDIDFDSLFKFIDRTTSTVGQQFLFKKLVEPTNEIEKQSEKLIQAVTDDKGLREKIQLELFRLSNYDGYHISSLMREKSLLEEPKWFKLLTLDLAIIGLLIVVSLIFPVLLIVLIFPFTLNMFLHYANKSNTFHFTRSIPQLNVLIEVSKKLNQVDSYLHDKSVELAISDLKSFQRKAKLISFDNEGGIQSELSQLGSFFTDFIKAFFLVEVIMLFKVIKELKDKQTSISTLFNYVGNIDASISIASLRSGKLKTCQPVFTTAKKELTVTNIYHPLIKNCVTNRLSINKKGILITGSNMSGKSTFLRTLAINSILAQTINTCFADEFVSPILKQFSSIRIDDNLFEGKSYYFQEVNVMGSLIEKVNLPNQNLFILDEVFKGTNTIERISAAKAILSYLNRNENIVIVSTHDIELADMLKDEYDLYHFTEIIENHELHLDHTIKPGQVRTRNAIKILELSEYPADVINEARQISLELMHTKKEV
jgi:DNA mismatch repair ATPase MutS